VKQLFIDAFREPSRLNPLPLGYALKFGDDSKQLGLVTYCVPVSPGKSRIVAQFPRSFKTLRLILAGGITSSERNEVLDGDMMLQQQSIFYSKKRTVKAGKRPTSYKRRPSRH